MKAIKKFKIFTWDRLLIYGGICALFLVLFGAAVNHNYIQTDHGIPVPGWIALVTATLGALTCSGMVFKSRWDFSKQITGYSDSGVVIMASNLPATSYAQVEAWTEAVIKDDVAFFSNTFPNPTDVAAKMVDAFNGEYLTFSLKPIPMDAKTSAANGTLAQFAVGMTTDGTVCVWWDVANEDFVTKVVPRLRHEFGHVCLNAAGVPASGQHLYMAKVGFPY